MATTEPSASISSQQDSPTSTVKRSLPSSSAGGSTVPDSVLVDLQGGDHDPRNRGFTLQAAELSFAAAVDPFFDAEMHLVYFIDPEG